MDYLDFTDLSPRNAEHSKWQVTVANGVTFIALNLSESEKFKATNRH